MERKHSLTTNIFNWNPFHLLLLYLNIYLTTRDICIIINCTNLCHRSNKGKNQRVQLLASRFITQTHTCNKLLYIANYRITIALSTPGVLVSNNAATPSPSASETMQGWARLSKVASALFRRPRRDTWAGTHVRPSIMQEDPINLLSCDIIRPAQRSPQVLDLWPDLEMYYGDGPTMDGLWTFSRPMSGEYIAILYCG